ncbi:MAG: cytochrome c nitrite reductase small subunit [Candidatus Eisenbacteria bacterium]|nr:cytochrome c nitrite reductase small subunit [Candidatus Eisenbacteria bacterium]
MRAGSAFGIVLGILVGATAGIGGYTFLYAKGGSYLTNDPEACTNCHVMREQFDGWMKSSHRNVAGCNDCHTPHAPVPKYATKAENGFRHSLAFTSGRFPEPIEITPHAREITEQACRHCHEEIVEAIDTGRHGDEKLSCIRCHRSVGHLR